MSKKYVSSKVTIPNQQISPAQWIEVSNLFERLSELPQAEAEALICVSQLSAIELKLLRKMLNANHDSSLLDNSIDDLAERLLQLPAIAHKQIPEDLIGRQFGPWRVIKELGRGGMGAVFEARRSDGQYEKSVALKVIKPGAYSEHTGQGFIEEMRTLARLEHPHIARLIDGGISGDDIPYFAMEYVDGVTITQYANAQNMGLSERVELLIQVCAAVEHAHRNLVVHGDLKPSNILVNRTGQVRLVDFGIARSLKPGDDSLSLPRFTPQYASPEQADGLPLSTASDVFGVTAVMFELCCGSPPRERIASVTSADFRASLNKPLSPPAQQFDSTPDPAAVASQRKMSVGQLRRSLKGDLGWIMLRGLALDPADRLPTVNELRAELIRWQRGLALESHPAHWTYRLKRWAGRHKASVTIAGVALAALTLAGASVVEQTHLAQIESSKAKWSNEFLLSIFTQADPVLNQQQPITVNELTGSAAVKLLEDNAQYAPQMRLEAAAVLGKVQSNLGQFESASQLSLLQLNLARQSDNSNALVAALLAHAESLTALDQLRPAVDVLREALDLAPVDQNVHPQALSVAQQLAMLLARLSEFDEARILVDSVLRYESSIASTPGGAASLSLVYSTRSEIERESGLGAQALTSVTRALDYAQQVGEDSRVYADALASKAALHHSLGDSQAAAEVDQQVVSRFDRLFGSDHPLTVQARSEFAVSLSQLGEMDRALSIYQEVLAGYRATLGEDNQFVAGTLANMGTAERALGQFKQSLDHYEQSLAIWDRLESAPPVSKAAVHLGYAKALFDVARYLEAERNFLTALDIIEHALGKDHALYSRAQAYYAPVLIQTGRLQQAETVLVSAYQKILEEYGVESKRTAIAGITLAQLRSVQGDLPGARALAQQAISVLDVPGLRQRHLTELGEAKQVMLTTSGCSPNCSENQ